MEKVIKICEMTGRVTTVATNLTTEEAKALVIKLTKENEFAMFRRVVG